MSQAHRREIYDGHMIDNNYKKIVTNNGGVPRDSDKRVEDDERHTRCEANSDKMVDKMYWQRGQDKDTCYLTDRLYRDKIRDD